MTIDPLRTTAEQIAASLAGREISAVEVARRAARVPARRPRAHAG
jgi:hypothetical protein